MSRRHLDLSGDQQSGGEGDGGTEKGDSRERKRRGLRSGRFGNYTAFWNKTNLSPIPGFQAVKLEKKLD